MGLVDPNGFRRRYGIKQTAKGDFQVDVTLEKVGEDGKPCYIEMSTDPKDPAKVITTPDEVEAVNMIEKVLAELRKRGYPVVGHAVRNTKAVVENPDDIVRNL